MDLFLVCFMVFYLIFLYSLSAYTKENTPRVFQFQKILVKNEKLQFIEVIIISFFLYYYYCPHFFYTLITIYKRLYNHCYSNNQIFHVTINQSVIPPCPAHLIPWAPHRTVSAISLFYR